LGPRLPGLADELLMLAEEARMKRLRGPIAVEVRSFPTPRRSVALIGATLGGAIAGALAVWLLLTE
ncbi:MAG: hypothetical protein AAGI70_03920, partial [Pseudomonadota bacterium]